MSNPPEVDSSIPDYGYLIGYHDPDSPILSENVRVVEDTSSGSPPEDEQAVEERIRKERQETQRQKWTRERERKKLEDLARCSICKAMPGTKRQECDIGH